MDQQRAEEIVRLRREVDTLRNGIGCIESWARLATTATEDDRTEMLKLILLTTRKLLEGK